MSLMRLLTAGKSLVGIRETQSRYRVTDHRLLPKFVSKANPFRATTMPGPAPAGSETAQPGAANPTPIGGGVEQSGAAAGGARNWLARVRQLMGSQRPSRTQSAIPRFNKPMVQVELSLESVKVVRNDLSDSDLEVVPSRAAQPPPSKAPPQRPEAEEAQAEPAWARVTGRLFGSGE